MRTFFSFLLLLVAITTHAQKEANYWYFGRNAGLDFSTNPPTPIKGELNTLEGCSTISDKNGNLLFYSDGTTVWTKNHTIMNYTDGSKADNLLGDPSSTQSALAIPKPGSNHIYYLFTVDDSNQKNGLNFYTIDITKSAGLGQITNGPINLPSSGNRSNWSEKVTAVQGSDCDTFWVISTNKTSFFAFKVDINGVSTTAVESPFGQFIETTRGSLKLSPDGKKLVLANQIKNSNSFIFDFNAQNGSVTNKIQLDLSEEQGYGVEFSNTSTKLYISTGIISEGTQTSNASIYQFDLMASDINSTRFKIHSEEGYRGALQLGLDGKIYYARSQKSYLGVINDPNKSGENTQFEVNGIQLKENTTSSEGLPPFIQSFFSPVKIVDSNSKTIDLTLQKQLVCIGDSFSFEPELVGVTGSTFKWTKESDASVIVNTRKITIDHSNYGSGIYNLEMSITDSCGRIRKYNGSVEIEFVPKPNVSPVPIYEQCDVDANPSDGKTPFNLSIKEAELTNNATDVTVDFFETTDVNFLSPIINKASYINTTSTNTGNHTLIARVTNTITGCYETGRIELKANATNLTHYKDSYETEIDLNTSIIGSRNSNGSGNTIIDFDQKTTNIIAESNGAFSLATHNFEYYRTADDATLQTNQIVAPFDDDFFINNEDIFIRVTTKNTSACSGIGQFKVFVNALPIPNGNIDPMYLCINNPKDSPQLLSINLDGKTGVSGDTYQWFLNGVLIPGATDSTYKATEQGEYKVESTRVYQNNTSDIHDNTTSKGYNTFTVIESNKALISSIELQDDQDDPTQNTLTIHITGIGEYEYALNSQLLTDFIKGNDNLTFQFTDVKQGLNTVYIRDINGCGIVSKKEISFIYFQRHFSPNNDGYYDTWKVQGADATFYSSIKVEIFDRHGKVMAIINQINDEGWDGTYNGKKLPSNDYWYNAILIDKNGAIRKKRGHFSLLRK